MKRLQRAHTDDITARLSDRSEVQAYAAARKKLAKNLVHTRDIPNGRDFLFTGDPGELREALRKLVEVEHVLPHHPLHLDYALIDEYFLLRITGTHRYGDIIRSYFEEGEELFKDFSLR